MTLPINYLHLNDLNPAVETSIQRKHGKISSVISVESNANQDMIVTRCNGDATKSKRLFHQGFP